MSDLGETFLYRHFDKNDELLYVGISLNHMARLAQHKLHSKWFAEIARVEVTRYSTRFEAIQAERFAIANEKPKHNVHHTSSSPRRSVEWPLSKGAPAEEKEGLTRRVVEFQPYYTITAAANALGMSSSTLRKLASAGQIGACALKRRRGVKKDGTEFEFIEYGFTGWQIIEYLEHLQDGVLGDV